MDCTYYLLEVFEELKNYFEWRGDGPLKKNPSEYNYLAFLKVFPGTF